MIWTLIIVAYLADGPTMTMHDFSSKEICIAVGHDVQKQIGGAALCVQKVQTDKISQMAP